jgi:hypothetical protein
MLTPGTSLRLLREKRRAIWTNLAVKGLIMEVGRTDRVVLYVPAAKGTQRGQTGHRACMDSSTGESIDGGIAGARGCRADPRLLTPFVSSTFESVFA